VFVKLSKCNPKNVLLLEAEPAFVSFYTAAYFQVFYSSVLGEMADSENSDLVLKVFAWLICLRATMLIV